MQNKFTAVKVALSGTSYTFDMEYTYFIPKKLEDKIQAGMRVLVPFGRANAKRIGVVLKVYFKEEKDPRIKPIINIIDNEPCINEELIEVIKWLHDNTFCTYFDGFKTVIPNGLSVNFSLNYTLNGSFSDENLTNEQKMIFSQLKKIKNKREFDEKIAFIMNEDKNIISEFVEKGVLRVEDCFKRKVGDDTVRMVRIADDFEEKISSFSPTKKQSEVIAYLQECESASVKEVCYLCAITVVVINNLIKKGILQEFEFQVFRSAISGDVEEEKVENICLSDDQNEAFEGIKAMIDEKKPSGALLHGVTGSGKTSVFIKLIDYVVKTGQTAMMLVPEIALTPQTVNKFRSLFGDIIAVVHSNLSSGQRLDEYQRIKKGDAKIVIGTRSAIFAPLENIGIIIMDEEGERSYKSEKNPRYHARDVAIFRCGKHNSVLLLASATPSIESYYFAKKGRFKLFELAKRYNKSPLPQVLTVDMQLEVENGNLSEFSIEMQNQIREKLQKNEQILLLLNRRGFHTYISCLDCRKPLVCPNCNIPLTFHKPNGQLICHYCGYFRPLDEICPECKSKKLKPSGIGTQKIYDEVEKLFPDAKIVRMDADTTYSKFSYEKNFADFRDGKYDIMVGTQMIAKGLDFPNVTLVGVLSLDKALFMGDFRSYERTFSLITQVVGRSGRADKEGIAFIQTYVPDHYVLDLAGKQDYKTFFEEEIALRKVMIYPPFCDICVIGFSSLVEKQVAEAAKRFVDMIEDKVLKEGIKMPLRVLGPSKCQHERINNKFRHRVIIKCKNTKSFREFISDLLKSTAKEKIFSNVNFFADINGDII